MKKNTLLYCIAFTLLLLIILFLNRTHNEITTYSQFTSRNSAVRSYFQNLSTHINNAAILHPDMAENRDSYGKLFFTDSAAIIQLLRQLRSTVRDSINIQITEKLSALINTEISWLLKSNVPDSISQHKASAHIDSFKTTDSLISRGIERTNFLIDYENAQLNKEIGNVKLWMIFFITLSGLLLIYTTVSFFKQRSKTKTKEKELETVLNRIDDGVVSVDNEWRYIFLNDAALVAHPQGKKNTIGKLLWEVHPELKDTVFGEKYREAMRTKNVVEIENYYAPMDKWFSVKVYPSADGLTIFYRDVTEGKKAEQELLQTLKEVNDYKFALDEASIVAITDQKGIIKHANQNFCKISKYTPEELIGQDHRIINSGYHSKEFIKNIWTTIANGKIWKGELRNKAKDGTIYWVDTTIVPFLNEEGKPYQYVAIRADITERKSIQENLERSLKETSDYKYALEESSIVAITDQKGIINYANDNFCKISKYDHEELVGQDHRIINSGHHSKEFIKNLWATIANGKIWKGELKNKAKDGTIYWVDTTIVPFLSDAGKPYQYVAIRSDITERKSFEENLERSLKETSDYKYALEESSIVAITDQKGIIKYANDNFCKISKYDREELVGQDHRIINSGYHPKEFIRHLWVTIANGKIWRGELKNKAKDGAIYWVDTTIVPFLDEKGKPYQYVAIRADITERKLAEENLLTSLKEIADYKYALDESSIVAITDQKGIIKYANENFCKISKYPEEELIGQDHRIINSGYHPKEFIKNIWTTIANGKIWKGELRNKAKDDTIYWVDTTIVPFLDEKGKPYQYVAIRADITERKLAEENLRASLKEVADYKYALDESSIVAITDQKGIIKYANENFCKISKYPTEELIGQDHRIINSAYHPKEFIKDLWTTIANGKIWKGELKNKAKDGTIYWVDTTIVPFLDEKGKPYQYVAIRSDITERKQAQEKIIDLNIDLEKKIKERTQQLKKSNEELEAFSYSVSHDLRAPLRGIIGFSSILEEDYGTVLDEEGKRITSVIKTNTLKMGRLIDDLLAFSRMGRQDIVKTTINTHMMVKEVIEELTAKEKAKDIEWIIHSLPKVNGDINTIRQVWINLISNAMKYSGNKERQRIEIGFSDQGRQFIFYVKDNGVGFDEKYKDKLFKVFQRLHSAEEFEGTGVGLALVEKIISKHGGKVWAEGKNNEGACFYFSLPA